MSRHNPFSFLLARTLSRPLLLSKSKSGKRAASILLANSADKGARHSCRFTVVREKNSRMILALSTDER